MFLSCFLLRTLTVYSGEKTPEPEVNPQVQDMVLGMIQPTPIYFWSVFKLLTSFSHRTFSAQSFNINCLFHSGFLWFICQLTFISAPPNLSTNDPAYVNLSRRICAVSFHFFFFFFLSLLNISISNIKISQAQVWCAQDIIIILRLRRNQFSPKVCPSYSYTSNEIYILEI